MQLGELKSYGAAHAHCLYTSSESRLLSIPRLLRSRIPGADFHDPSIFFCHTAGRWLDNETGEQRRRYLAFDIAGLKAAAVAAVEGAKSVLHMTKRRVRIAKRKEHGYILQSCGLAPCYLYYYHVLTDPLTLLFAALAGASSSWGSMLHIVRTFPPCHHQSWMLI